MAEDTFGRIGPKLVEFKPGPKTGVELIIDELRKIQADEVVVVFRKGHGDFSMLSSFTSSGDTHFFLTAFLNSMVAKYLKPIMPRFTA